MIEAPDAPTFVIRGNAIMERDGDPNAVAAVSRNWKFGKAFGRLLAGPRQIPDRIGRF